MFYFTIRPAPSGQECDPIWVRLAPLCSKIDANLVTALPFVPVGRSVVYGTVLSSFGDGRLDEANK